MTTARTSDTLRSTLDRDRPKRRGRILLVSYHFGDQGETGGFRWNAMVRDLVKLGWRFDVITNDKGALSAGEPESRAERTVELFRVPTSRMPQRVFDLLLAVPRLLKNTLPRARTPVVENGSAPPISLNAVSVWRPGAREGFRTRLAKALQGLTAYAADRIWVGRAVRVGTRLARTRGYECVVVSSPPHTTQLVGVAISRSQGLSYVADFRDPWVAGTGVLKPYINAVTRLVAQVHEPRILRAADVVVFNTPEARDRSIEEFGSQIARREVVPNGYDDSPVAARTPDRDVFRILFAGWLHGYMDARALIGGAARLLSSTRLDPQRFSLEFLGTGREFGGVPLMEIARACGINQCTTVYDRRSRREAQEFQQRAAVLVAYTCPHGLEIAMKFYDYTRMHGSLLLIGHVTGALAKAAERVGARVVAPDDHAGIDAVLHQAYERWLQGHYEAPHDREGIFARAHRSREMDAILTTLHDGPGARPGVSGGRLATVGTPALSSSR
jgi:hypothetical protein